MSSQTLELDLKGPLKGEMRPPSDKSLTHRAYMFAAIARGESLVKFPLKGEDCENTLRVLTQLGLRWEDKPSGRRLIPTENWLQPNRPLDCGNSGTTMRLMSGLIASRDLDCTLVGDHSLSRRPMKRIAEPLRKMGATIEGDTPPLRVKGGNLEGIRYESAVASAQIKSCVLLAGLKASGETWVREPELSRDHTERMLQATGVEVLRGEHGVGVRGGSTLSGFEFSVPADISSAAFFMVAAAISPGSDLLLTQVGTNPSRTGILDVLEQVGAAVEVSPLNEELGEPVSDIRVRYKSGLKPFSISGALVPRLIDEIPVLAVLATRCEGVSSIRGAKELRVKESDRIEVMAKHLRSMGAKVETFEDGMDIEGPVNLSGGEVHADGDHRIAMSFAVASLISKGKITIHGADSIATSFPGFESELTRLTK